MRIRDWSSDVCSSDLTPDGTAETGIFIAEDVTAGIALYFVKATPEYLADFERRHARATEAYRRQQAAEAADSGFDFGQVLALGLGAAVISSADLPGVDKMQLGQAFVSDVLGERSEEHTSELQSLMRSSYAVFCLKKKKKNN